jgi:hypothetical protein
MKTIKHCIAPLLGVTAMMSLSACATQQGPRPVASIYYREKSILTDSREPVASDNSGMKVKTSKSRIDSLTSKTTPSGQTSKEKTTEIIRTDTPAAALPASPEVVQSNSTTNFTTATIAAPDSELKPTNP